MAKKSKDTKKLTIKYWLSLEKGSQERALKHVFPIHLGIVDMLLSEKPTTDEIKHGFWSLVFSKIREVKPDERGYRYYKTCFMNSTYIP